LITNLLSTDKQKIGDPLEYVSSNREVLTRFGERADISPDNKSIAFMAKAFGDAMEIDLQSRNITGLTCSITAAAFLRVMHLSNGDYLLIGPEHFENAQISKAQSESWYLNKKKGLKPMKLGVKLSEDVAVSKKQLKIAYAQSGSTSEIPSQIIVADIGLSGLRNKSSTKKQLWKGAIKFVTLKPRIFLMISNTLISVTCPMVLLKSWE
jgi:hypothetical protein